MKKAILTLLVAAVALPMAAAAEEGRPIDRPDRSDRAERADRPDRADRADRASRVRELDVEGPLLLKGRGRLTGELTMASPSETRAVVFGGSLGAIKLVDLAGDLRVRCQGRGATVIRENDEGQKVVVCRGVGGRVRVHGSHFEVQLIARTYGALLPAGVTGTLKGLFRTCVPGETCGQGEPSRGDEAKRPRPPADRAPKDDEAALDSTSRRGP